MHFAFCLFKYFPFGGLQRDFIKIARAALARGHQVSVFTMVWQGPREPGLTIEIVKAWGFTNHARACAFSKAVALRLQAGTYDAVLGFNRQAGLDFYFAADPCLAVQLNHKKMPWLPRYRRYLALEAAVYGAQAATHVFLLDAKQQAVIQAIYHTPCTRFSVLPAGIDRPLSSARIDMRAAMDVTADTQVLLAVGYDQVRKGLDRTLSAVQALAPNLRANVQLWVVGHVGTEAFAEQVQALGMGAEVRFLGNREDVYALMQAADLLLHPAYQETAGMVLVEALANGLPVIVTANCGYAFHVAEAGAGHVIPGGAEFDQSLYNKALVDALACLPQGVWQEAACRYVAGQDFFSLSDVVLSHLEGFAKAYNG